MVLTSIKFGRIWLSKKLQASWIWFLQLFVSFHKSPQLSLKIGDMKKNAFIRFFTSGLVDNESVASKSLSRGLFSSVQQPEWGDALSAYNWITEPFHQIIPCTIVGQQSRTLVNLFIQGASWTNTAPCVLSKRLPGSLRLIDKKANMWSLVLGGLLLPGALAIGGQNKIEFISICSNMAL